MENKFCFLKGIVECDSGRIQDCNNKRTVTCPLEEEKSSEKGKKKAVKKEHKKEGKKRNRKRNKKQAFCYLNGLVDCSAGRVQDCNIKRVEKCPLD